MPLHLVCTLAVALLCLARPAVAQVEFRCPPGWSRSDNSGSVRTTPHPQSREALAMCTQPTGGSMVLTVDQLDAPLAPEAAWLHQRLPQVTIAPSFFDGPIRGVNVPTRITEWTYTQPAMGHHAQMVQYGRAALFAVGTGRVTVVSMGIESPDFAWNVPESAALAATHRTVFEGFVRSMVGLDGSIARWHATATCPTGTVSATDGLQIVRGWRQVVRCRSSDGAVDVEVRESRIHVSNVAEARREAQLANQIQPWASSPPDDALAGTMHAVAIGDHPAYMASLMWPVMRDMGRDNRPRSARLVQVVIPTPLGNVQIGWLARGASASQATGALRSYVTTGVVP